MAAPDHDGQGALLQYQSRRRHRAGRLTNGWPGTWLPRSRYRARASCLARSSTWLANPGRWYRDRPWFRRSARSEWAHRAARCPPASADRLHGAPACPADDV